MVGVSLRLMPRRHGTLLGGRHVTIDGKYFHNSVRAQELLLDWLVATGMEKKGAGREIL